MSVETYTYWKNNEGEVFAFEEGFEIPSNLRQMTSDEVDAHLNRVPSMWTNGTSLREAFRMDISGWRIATDQEIAEIVYMSAIEAAQYELNKFRKLASDNIDPLQDMRDVGEDTPDSNNLLSLWKKYRVELNNIVGQAGYPTQINWPNPPV